jgi:hypothetical protein
MARTVTPLTDPKCEAARYNPAGTGNKLADGGGLFLLLKPTGSKSWRMKYTRPNGKEDTLGQLHGFDLKTDILSVDEDGDQITSCVVIPAAKEKRAPKLSQSQTVALAALRRVQKEQAIPAGLEERWAPEVPAKIATASEWREAAYLDGISGPDVTDDAKQKAFKRAAQELAKRELVRQFGDFYWTLS